MNAFGNLLGDVAKFAQAHGLSGEDVVVSGHSLGGLAVNSMAAQSDANWGGFYAVQHAASPRRPSTKPAARINIGYENDPVSVRSTALLTLPSLGVRCAARPATNNIVNFNDHYASDARTCCRFPFSTFRPRLSHLPFFYQDGLMRVLNSEFYSLTDKDSTIIVSNLRT